MQNSDRVKSFRVRMKERIVNSMGGKCCVCGYNKCNNALALHHLNPSEKEFSISKIRANFVSWEKVVSELKKCVLVCHNCHSEIHAGIISVPENAAKFNEEYSDYKSLEKIIYYCKCGKEKKKQSKTCGDSNCHSKRFDWSNVDLENLCKSMTNVEIARLLGISETAVRKRKKKLNIL